jgi:hypothetical protein
VIAGLLCFPPPRFAPAGEITKALWYFRWHSNIINSIC